MGATIAATFEMPPGWAPWFARLLSEPRWRGVAALDNGQMIGGGLLHLQGSNAWLGAGGVRPEARRRGAHRAMMTLRIQEAIDAGCTRIITETGEAMADEPNPSLRNMEACGLNKICSRLNYAAPT